MDYIALTQSYINGHDIWLYPLLFLIAWIEGPMIMLFSGFMVSLGVFDWRIVYPVLLFGDLFGDFVLYFIGYFGARKTIKGVANFFKVDFGLVPKIEKKFLNNPRRVIFISKITMGFGFAIATLLTAGMIRIKLKEFALFNFLGGLLFTATLMIIGFFVGQAYETFGRRLELLSTFAIVIIILVLMTGIINLLRLKFFSKK
ncbi:MAG: hypothetical protein WCG01_04785 [bacterium]